MSERKEGLGFSSSSSDAHPQPHVIVFPFPTQGHVNPMMEFANQLHSKGVLVTLILTQYIQRRILYAYASASASSKQEAGRGIRVVLISDGLPEEMDRMGNYWELINAMNGYGNAEFEKVVLHNFVETSEPITCIVADSFLPNTKHVAEKNGIPWLAFWTQPLCVYTTYYHAFFHLSLPTSSVVGSRQEETVALLNSIPGFPTMETCDLPSFLQTEDITEIGYQYFLLQFKYMQATPILANSFEELEEESILAMKNKASLTCIGPLLPPTLFKGIQNKDQQMDVKRGSSLFAEEWTCVEWLNQKAPKSVLYVSFGSLISFPKEQIEEILVGVCESGVTFLWATRDMHKDLYNILEEYNTNANVDANRINACNNAMFVGWVPQLAVLSHVALGGFLTHVGWNSTLESIACGVPMLTMPCFSDQTTNAKFVSDTWKSALRLQPKHGSCGLVTRDVIKEGVQSLFSPNSPVQDRAHQLHEAAHKAVAKGGSSHSNFQSFVNNLFDKITP